MSFVPIPTVKTQSPQLSVACQIIIGHHGDVVVREVKTQGVVCYHGNPREAVIGAVTGEPKVTATAGWPLVIWV